jgi:hypothetical protein
MHLRTWFKPLVANCFATDRSTVVTLYVFIFVVCGVYFEIDYFINHALFFLSVFGCVERLCLLDAGISDMLISLFKKEFTRKRTKIYYK